MDTVIHNAALVNHVFSYAQLFLSNVVGTVNVIKFSISKRVKAISYTSTVAAVASMQRKNKGAIKEDEDAQALYDGGREGKGSYASGYGSTKWGGEVLLKKLNESQLHVPVNIFRCGLILSHSKYLGQINETDFFTRMLCGVVVTGVVPESFYEDKASKGNHINGLPVDFVASSIVSIAHKVRDGCR